MPVDFEAVEGTPLLGVVRGSSLGLVEGEERQLGVIQGTAIIVNVILGTGVFVCTGEVLSACGSPAVALLAWAFSGVLCSLGALCYAELGTAFPDSGGEYIYFRSLISRPVAFAFVWANLLLLKSGSQSIIALIFARYLCSVVFGLSLNEANPDADWHIKLVAMALLVALCLVNCMGVAAGAKLNVVLSTLTMTAIVFIGSMGLMAARENGLGNLLTPSSPAVEERSFFQRVSDFGLSLLLCLWAYDGWNNLNYAAGHLRSPEKNLPRCIFLGMATVTVGFLLTNVSYMLVLDIPTVLRSSSIAVSTAQRMFGQLGQLVMASVVSVSAAGGANSSILTGAQIFLAAGKDGMLPQWFAHVGPTSGAPTHALAAQCAWSCFLLTWGSFSPLVQCFSLVMYVFYGLAMVALVVVRRSGRASSAVYRVPLYPLPPLLFSALAVGMIINGALAAPQVFLLAALVLLSGVPVYCWLNYRPISAPAGAQPLGSVGV
eukprot:RCo027950